LCVFHVLQDVTDKVLDAVRRLRRACERRGKAGRKRKRGRPKKGTRKKRGAGKGPTTNKEKAAFIFKRRYLIVKRAESLSEQERADLEVMFGYLPELKVLWGFSQEVYKVWQTEQSLKVARWRWARLVGKPEYQQIRELGWWPTRADKAWRGRPAIHGVTRRDRSARRPSPASSPAIPLRP
jgi:Transposase